MDDGSDVSADTRKAVQWLLVALIAAQLLIVPWSYNAQGLLDSFPTSTVGYGPVWSPPSQPAQVAVGRLAIQLAVTGGLLILWLAKTEPGGPPTVT